MTAVHPWPSYGAARARLNSDSQQAASRPAVSVTCAGNLSVEFLIPGVCAALNASGFSATTRAMPFDSWIPEALAADPGSDVWVIWLSALGGSRGGTDRPEMDVASVRLAVQSLCAKGVVVVVVLPEALDAEDDPFSPFATWRSAWCDDLRAALADRAVLLSVEPVQRRIGMAKWTAKRYWSVAKVPCHPDAATAVGWVAGETVARVLRQDVRAVVVDLDDTLWAGVVGDDGVAGLGLDRDGTGRPFLELQRFLKDLSERGIPLSVVSKNERAIAERPFRERDEMILRMEDFVYFEASWQPKYQAIQQIIESLNLSPNQVCFLDDSVFERDQAREFVPGLLIPDLNADPELRVSDLVRSGLFSLPLVRKEDLERVRMYKAERDRRHAATSMSEDDYLQGLEMALEAEPVSDSNLPRVASLVQKTNQFNLTNERPSPREILDFSQAVDNYAFAFRLRDRFGDYGIISVVLVEPSGTDELEIRNWVMSCRVFNRGVEAAVFQHLCAWAETQQRTAVRGRYRRTAKNGLLAAVMPRLGLQPASEAGDAVDLRCDPTCAPPAHFIRVTGAYNAP